MSRRDIFLNDLMGVNKTVVVSIFLGTRGVSRDVSRGVSRGIFEDIGNFIVNDVGGFLGLTYEDPPYEEYSPEDTDSEDPILWPVLSYHGHYEVYPDYTLGDRGEFGGEFDLNLGESTFAKTMGMYRISLSRRVTEEGELYADITVRLQLTPAKAMWYTYDIQVGGMIEPALVLHPHVGPEFITRGSVLRVPLYMWMDYNDSGIVGSTDGVYRYYTITVTGNKRVDYRILYDSQYNEDSATRPMFIFPQELMIELDPAKVYEMNKIAITHQTMTIMGGIEVKPNYTRQTYPGEFIQDGIIYREMNDKLLLEWGGGSNSENINIDVPFRHSFGPHVSNSHMIIRVRVLASIPAITIPQGLQMNEINEVSEYDMSRYSVRLVYSGQVLTQVKDRGITIRAHEHRIEAIRDIATYGGRVTVGIALMNSAGRIGPITSYMTLYSINVYPSSGPIPLYPHARVNILRLGFTFLRFPAIYGIIGPVAYRYEENNVSEIRINSSGNIYYQGIDGIVRDIVIEHVSNIESDDPFGENPIVRPSITDIRLRVTNMRVIRIPYSRLSDQQIFTAKVSPMYNAEIIPEFEGIMIKPTREGINTGRFSLSNSEGVESETAVIYLTVDLRKKGETRRIGGPSNKEFAKRSCEIS